MMQGYPSGQNYNKYVLMFLAVNTFPEAISEEEWCKKKKDCLRNKWQSYVNDEIS